MARRPASPARTLTIFFISVAVLYGLVALGGSWKPALGLDLEGGTRIRLAATGNDVTAEYAPARPPTSSTAASTAPVSPRPR